MKIKTQIDVTEFIARCQRGVHQNETYEHPTVNVATILEHELRHTVAEPDLDTKRPQVSIVRTQDDVTEFVRDVTAVGKSPMFKRHGIGVIETAEWMLRSAVEREFGDLRPSHFPPPHLSDDIETNELRGDEHAATLRRNGFTFADDTNRADVPGHAFLCDINRGDVCNCGGDVDHPKLGKLKTPEEIEAADAAAQARLARMMAGSNFDDDLDPNERAARAMQRSK